MSPRANTLDDLWRHVDSSGGPDACWPFTGGKQRGYGVFTVNYRSIRSNRAAWMATYGEIPDGLVVCHRRDNPPCCNPRHLFLGTLADNNADMYAKGRGKDVTHAAQHGTYSGYVKHVRDRAGEWSVPACDPCREANRLNQLDYQRRRSQSGTLAKPPHSGPQQSAARVSDATAPHWPESGGR